ncbi:hypothetical protein [Spirosoma telluris]
MEDELQGDLLEMYTYWVKPLVYPKPVGDIHWRSCG